MRRLFCQPSNTGPLVALEHSRYALTVAPGFGARMVSFRYADRDILRPTPDAVLAKPEVYGFAGFPLMPYSGPLFGPGFTFAGAISIHWPGTCPRSRRRLMAMPGPHPLKFAAKPRTYSN
jgi:hypothetical protein